MRVASALAALALVRDAACVAAWGAAVGYIAGQLVHDVAALFR